MRMYYKRHAAAVHLRRSCELPLVVYICALTNAPLESPNDTIRSHIYKCLLTGRYASQWAQARKLRTIMGQRRSDSTRGIGQCEAIFY
jgi:hypothetical protein